MNKDSRLREIILKNHLGEPLTEEEQAILDAETAGLSLSSAKVWDHVRSHMERKQEPVVVRPWYIRWPAVTAAVAASVLAVAVGVYRYIVPADGPAGALAKVQRVWRTV